MVTYHLTAACMWMGLESCLDVIRTWVGCPPLKRAQQVQGPSIVWSYHVGHYGLCTHGSKPHIVLSVLLL